MSQPGWRARLPPHLAPLIVALLSFVMQTYVAYGPFRAHPNSMDEYGYWYQAEIFARGTTHLAEPPPALEPLRELYMEWHDGKLFSKYPPGFSLVLSLGARLGVAPMVNPLLASVSLLLLFAIARRLVGQRYALAAQLLMATNPYFIAYSASFFAHPLALLLTVLVLYLVTDPSAQRPPFLLALGGVLGVFVWVRPLDALCACLLVGFVALGSHGWRGALRTAKGASVPFVALLVGFVVYNHYLSGRIALSTYPVLDGEFQLTAIAGGGLWENARAVAANYAVRFVMVGFVVWEKYFLRSTAYLVPLLALAGLVFGRRDRWHVALALHFASLVLLYNFHNTYAAFPAWPQYGVRYWYPGFACLVLLAVKAVAERDAALGNGPWQEVGVRVLIVGFVIVVQLGVGATLLQEYRHRFDVVAAVQRDIDRRCPGKRLVVLERSGEGPDPPLPTFVIEADFQRNPFFSEHKFFTLDPNPPATLLAALPGRPLCRYDFLGWNSSR